MRRRANSSLHAFDTCLENKLKRLLQEREREREGKIDENKQGGDGDGRTEWLKTRF